MTVIKAAVFFGSQLLLPALFFPVPAWLLADLIKDRKGKDGDSSGTMGSRDEIRK